MNKKLWISLLISFLCSNCLFAAKIHLKNGFSIEGEILSKDQSRYVVDLGFTVLTVPMDVVADVSDNQDDASEEKQVDDILKSDSKLYYQKNNRKFRSLENCFEQVSEACVMVSTPAGLGSGFFISEDGHLITNFHVIEKETKLTVTMFKKLDKGFEKKKFEKVKIVAINPFIDLALLKIEDLGDIEIKPVPMGNMNQTNVGEAVFAVGNPLGLERSMSQGVISTKSRAIEGLVYIQTTTDINPGNSGGPLMNLAGEVVGVTSMGYMYMGGLNFAIPVNYVKHFIENRDAFAYDKDNPNSGYKYFEPGEEENNLGK